MNETKLVPVEPTEEMLNALCHKMWVDNNAIDVWKAMVAAAPTPECRKEQRRIDEISPAYGYRRQKDRRATPKSNSPAPVAPEPAPSKLPLEADVYNGHVTSRDYFAMRTAYKRLEQQVQVQADWGAKQFERAETAEQRVKGLELDYDTMERLCDKRFDEIAELKHSLALALSANVSQDGYRKAAERELEALKHDNSRYIGHNSELLARIQELDPYGRGVIKTGEEF